MSTEQLCNPISALKLSKQGFLIEQQDGRKRYYGQSASSRVDITSGSSTETFMWLLERIEDRNGNNIYFEYEIDGSKNQYAIMIGATT